MSHSTAPIQLAEIWESREPSDWLISSWDAGQSSITTWSSDNVQSTLDGGVNLILDANETGDGRAFEGGEIQSGIKSELGTWSWTAQAPEMIDGTVFGMFLYKADWQNDPWLEYDFEFVGNDTTKVQLNVHMEDANGKHITLKDAPIIDLGFDAAEAPHTYEITVEKTYTAFEIDGKEVGRFDASDMPGGVWYTGELRSFVDLWAVPESMEGWAGVLEYGGKALVAQIKNADFHARVADPSEDYGTAVDADQPIELAQIWEKRDSDDFLISSWDAGQSSTTTWGADNVRRAQDGAVELVLDANEGGGRPYAGGEIQSSAKATMGTWSWEAQAPEMVDGAVFGMFLYKADWKNDPWLEYDFEFVGGDTTKVQINVHMEDANGKHIMMKDAPIIDLGFDAAEGVHLYEITVREDQAIFLVDGKEVARVSSDDMPGGVWYNGPMRSFVDLWAVPDGMSGWAGKFDYDGEPLVARLESIGIRPGDMYLSADEVVEDLPVVEVPAPEVDPEEDVTPPEVDIDVPAPEVPEPDPIVVVDPEPVIEPDPVVEAPEPEPTPEPEPEVEVEAPAIGNLRLVGTSDADILTGAAGNDRLIGGKGTDILSGNAGDDRLVGGDDSDILSGGAGRDRLLGGDGNDILTGDAGHDILKGGYGNDIIDGGAGNDRIFLEDGFDQIDGGAGQDWLMIGNTEGARVDLKIGRASAKGETDSLTGIENVAGSDNRDFIKGDDNDNILRGNAGNDILFAEGGRDRIIGGHGRDVMFGSADGDVDMFVFNSVEETSVGHGRDEIRNFEQGIDLLVFRKIDANTDMSGNQAFSFSDSGPAANAIWTSQKGANLIVHGDNNGDGQADFELTMRGITDLGAQDFIL